MKKLSSIIKKTALLSLGCILGSQSLLAITQDDNVYFKSTLGMTVLESKHSEKQVHSSSFLTNDNLSGGFAVGKRYYHIGAELAYINMGKQTYYSYKNTKTTDYYNQNFSVDLNSYHDIIENLEFKTALGLGMLHTKTTVADKELNSRAEIRGRAGVGLQYNFTKLINANYEFMLQGGNKDFTTHISNYLSVRYNFM